MRSWHAAKIATKPLNAERQGFQVEVSAVRDVALGVGRLALACRSADLTCVFRGIRSEHDTLRFWMVDDSNCPIAAARARQGVTSVGGEPDPPRTIPSGVGKFKILGVSLRYFGPKQRHSMPTRSHGYTDWFTVPGAPDVCFASLLYYYVRASELLPAGMHDDALFCSQNKHKTHGSQHFGLQSSSLATLMGKMMEAAGIPADFLPHSATVPHRPSGIGKLSCNVF